MIRREAREAVFGLLFESEFRHEEAPETIFETSTANREIEEDDYIREVYFGTMDKQSEIDAMLEKHARGWKVSRMSRVSRTILRLAAYEMMYLGDRIPVRVTINEAVELSKKYDEERARGFVNGILNAVKNDLSESANASEANESPEG